MECVENDELFQGVPEGDEDRGLKNEVVKLRADLKDKEVSEILMPWYSFH